MDWDTVSFDTSRTPATFGDDGEVRSVRLIVNSNGKAWKHELPITDRADVLADTMGVDVTEELLDGADIERMGVLYNPQKDEYKMLMIAHVGRDEPTWWMASITVEDRFEYDENNEDSVTTEEI